MSPRTVRLAGIALLILCAGAGWAMNALEAKPASPERNFAQFGLALFCLLSFAAGLAAVVRPRLFAPSPARAVSPARVSRQVSRKRR